MIKLTLANENAVRYACTKFHYAKRTPVSIIAFNVYQNEVWCGVIVYGFGANKNLSKPFKKWNGQVLELVRVALNGKHNITSQCLALSLKLLKKYTPCVDLIVSFADLDQNHKGVIYQATNWIYLGKFNENTRVGFLIKNKKMHNRSVASKNWKQSLPWIKQNVDKNAEEEISAGKHKYIYPLNEKTKKQFMHLAKPYPI